MIVNERENKRTIDTETGVYLRQMGTDSREMVWKFSVFDGDTVIAFEASRSGKRLVPGAKVFSVHYFLDLNILFRGTPKRKGYWDLIERLLIAYSDAYGPGQKEVVTTAAIKDALRQKLESWEAIGGAYESQFQ